MKHTTGTWRAVKVETHGVKGFEIHYSDDGECITDHVYTEEDANLIAASPALLNFIDYLVKSKSLRLPDQREAEELIEKAKGEA